MLAGEENEITVRESSNAVTASVNGLEISFSKPDGTILSVINERGDVSTT